MAPFTMLFPDLWDEMKEKHTIDVIIWYGYKKGSKKNAVMDVQKRIKGTKIEDEKRQ